MEGMTVEHRELSFHKRSDAFNAQAYEIYVLTLRMQNYHTCYRIKWAALSSCCSQPCFCEITCILHLRFMK